MSDYLSAQPGEPGSAQFASNNPFRNRAVSPSLPSPSSPFADSMQSSSSGRPVSRNPFLDPAASDPTPKSNTDLLIDLSMPPSDNHQSKSSMSDIFSALDIDDKSILATSSSGKDAPRRPLDGPSGRGRPSVGPPPRAKNMPPRPPSPPSHRPSRSQEVGDRRTGPSSSSRNPPPSGAPRDGSSSSRRQPPPSSRPRRNSESSVAGDKATSKERPARDSHRRDPSSRDRVSSTRPNRRNDIIDQLDATSIFGTVFHHDGPFDALNPHRNRKGSRRAPMQAFPKDSLNNVLGGAGPLNQRPDHKTFMGQGEDEAFHEFATREKKMGSSAIEAPVFDPKSRGDYLHGDESLGLGTSTFLEGTPAARTVIQRREAEHAQAAQDGSLQRKKSLAQRFRSINRGPQSSRAYSQDGAPGLPQGGGYGSYRSDRSERPPLPNDEFSSGGGEDVLNVRPKINSPPRGAPLERRSTAEDVPSFPPPPKYDPAPSTSSFEDSTKPGGGLLARVKSLKGGRRAPPPPPTKRDS